MIINGLEFTKIVLEIDNIINGLDYNKIVLEGTFFLNKWVGV